MASYDALVIGGGPAGATAALLLARGGRRVALVEKAAFPRRKVCGEYLAPPAAAFLRSLGMPLEPALDRIAIWIGERTLSAPLARASALAREDLDSFLARSDVFSHWIARAQLVGREILQRPLLMGAIALAVFAARPKRLIEIAASGWWVWRVYSRVRQVLR